MAFFALAPSGNAVSVASMLVTGLDFEPDFSDHCGFPEKRTLLTDSATAALYVALRGLASPGPALRGVAVPAWCCPSVPQAVLQAGLRPVPVDMDPSTLSYDSQALREARKKGLLAVVLVHFFGIPHPIPAGDWGDTVFLRDCAQDFDYRRADGEALACFYSFGRGKALNAGHGGALCLPGEGPWSDACRAVWEALPVSRSRPLLKAAAINWLSHPRIFWALARLPFLGIGKTVWEAPLAFARLAPGFFPVGSACLRAYAGRRPFFHRVVGDYRNLFAACSPRFLILPDSLDAIDAGGAGVGRASGDRLPVRFPVLVRDARLRETLLREMNRRFGGVTVQYPATLPSLPGAPGEVRAAGPFPGAEQIAREILTFPVTAALQGRLGPFFTFLEEILRGAGALPEGPIPGGESPQRAPGRQGLFQVT